MKKLAMYIALVIGAGAFAQNYGPGFQGGQGFHGGQGHRAPQGNGRGYGFNQGMNLHVAASRLEQLAQIFDEQVERRFFRSPVRLAADDFADAAQELREEIEDGDVREIQREFAKLSRAHYALEAAYGRCTAVPRDPYLSQLWSEVSQLYRIVASQLGGVARPPVHRPGPAQVPAPGYRQNPYGNPYGAPYGRAPYGAPRNGGARHPQRRQPNPPPQCGRGGGPGYYGPQQRTQYSPYGF